MDLKCCPCTDEAIGKGAPFNADELPAAVTMAPWAQVFTVGGQQIIGVTPLPVCKNCRAAQLGRPSSNGRLLTA